MTVRARFSTEAARTLNVWALSVSLLGCGSADETRAARPGPPKDVGFESGVNTCPSFAFYLVLPRVIRAGEMATVTALATDADSDDTQLGYAWSATAGDFSEPASALTDYACAEVGAQQLRVVASDPDGCESLLDLDVTCEAP